MTRTMQALVVVLTGVMTARGIDYVTGNSYLLGRVWGDSLTMPEMWGTASLIVAGISLIGLLFKKPRIILNAAIGGAAVCLMFAYQVANVRMFSWPPEDIRLMVDHLGHSATWALIAASIHYRMGVERKKEEILEGDDG